MRGLVFLFFLFVASPAWAFNSFQLMDPAFQNYILFKLPLASTVLMGLADFLALWLLLKPQGIKPGLLLFRATRANLLTIYVNLLALALVLLSAADLIVKTEYQLPMLFAGVYFMLAFAWFAWWKKVQLVELAPEMKRRVQVILGVTTSIAYAVVYYVIYLKLFAYPG